MCLNTVCMCSQQPQYHCGCDAQGARGHGATCHPGAERSLGAPCAAYGVTDLAWGGGCCCWTKQLGDECILHNPGPGQHGFFASHDDCRRQLPYTTILLHLSVWVVWMSTADWRCGFVQCLFARDVRQAARCLVLWRTIHARHMAEPMCSLLFGCMIYDGMAYWVTLSQGCMAVNSGVRCQRHLR